jgi:hypothetical protein
VPVRSVSDVPTWIVPVIAGATVGSGETSRTSFSVNVSMR